MPRVTAKSFARFELRSARESVRGSNSITLANMSSMKFGSASFLPSATSSDKSTPDNALVKSSSNVCLSS